MNILIEYEHIIRTSIFLALLVILGSLEFFLPLAKRKCSRIKQWAINLSMVVIDSIAVRLCFPLLAVGAAQYADDHTIGIFNLIVLPDVITVVIALLLLDLLIYAQHMLFHRIPILWSLHKVHHTEIALDVTSAVRFHPVEIMLSMLIKIAFVLLMGIPVLAVILFEISLNSLALFNHSNLKLPEGLDKILRKIIITPEVHWIHHSQIVKETNSNYGFNLIIWDKLFSTYTEKPTFNYPEMQQGLAEYSAKVPLNLYHLLLLPFKKRNKRTEAR